MIDGYLHQPIDYYAAKQIRYQLDPTIRDTLINKFFAFDSSETPTIRDALESLPLLVEEVVFYNPYEEISQNPKLPNKEKIIEYRKHMGENHRISITLNSRKSVKPYNIIVNQKKALEFAVEAGISTSAITSDTALIIKFLYIVMFGLKFQELLTIKLSKDDIDAIVYMCNKKAFSEVSAISIDEIMFSDNELKELIRIGSIKETADGKVYLAESVQIKNY